MVVGTSMLQAVERVLTKEARIPLLDDEQTYLVILIFPGTLASLQLINWISGHQPGAISRMPFPR